MGETWAISFISHSPQNSGSKSVPLELCLWSIPHQNHRGTLKSKCHALTLNLHLGWGQKPAFEQAGWGGRACGQGGCLVSLPCPPRSQPFHVSYRAKLMATVDRGHPHGWSHLGAFSWVAVQPPAPQCSLGLRLWAAVPVSTDSACGLSRQADPCEDYSQAHL